MYYIFSGKLEFWTLFVLIYAVIAIIVVILERKRPEKTISWLLVFAVFPLVGFAVYLFFGRNWKKSKLTSDIDLESSLTVTQEEIKRLERVLGNVSDEYIQLINLLERTSRSPLYFGNDVTIFKDGKEKFSSFFKEIEDAKETIHLEYYLVKGDATGKKLKDLLIKKAKEGVKVKFIIDKIGARLRKNYIKDLEEAGVELALYTYFLSPLLKFINTQVNYRNHRKIAIIDGQIAYIGGLNIGDEYLGKGRLGYWRDVHLKIEGQAVNGLQKVFLEDFRKIKSIDGKKEFDLDT
ncbi:MAG: phospholipase D-like domain-containing protein, partial [Defluviitoga tunisiensis]|nr:phospholipase D-like domain-containing protein [Defluviitoga tunisiensis]